MYTIHKLIVMGGLWEIADTAAVLEQSTRIEDYVARATTTHTRTEKDLDEPEPSIEEALQDSVPPYKIIAEWDDSGFDDDTVKGNFTTPLSPLFGKIYVEGDQIRFSGLRMDAKLYHQDIIMYAYDGTAKSLSGDSSLQNLKDASRKMNWVPIVLSEILKPLQSLGNDRNKTAIDLAHLDLYKIKKMFGKIDVKFVLWSKKLKKAIGEAKFMEGWEKKFHSEKEKRLGTCGAWVGKCVQFKSPTTPCMLDLNQIKNATNATMTFLGARLGRRLAALNETDVPTCDEFTCCEQAGYLVDIKGWYRFAGQANIPVAVLEGMTEIWYETHPESISAKQLVDGFDPVLGYGLAQKVQDYVPFRDMYYVQYAFDRDANEYIYEKLQEENPDNHGIIGHAKYFVKTDGCQQWHQEYVDTINAYSNLDPKVQTLHYKHDAGGISTIEFIRSKGYNIPVCWLYIAISVLAICCFTLIVCLIRGRRRVARRQSLEALREHARVAARVAPVDHEFNNTY